MNRELEKAIAKLSELDLSSNEGVSNDEIKAEIDSESETTKDTLEKRTHKEKHRNIWGWVLLCMVIVGFVASYVIIILIGAGVLQYSDNQFAVPSVIAAGIIGTYGLAKIAVSYFFAE